MRYIIIKEKSHQKLVDVIFTDNNFKCIENKFTDGDNDILVIDVHQKEYTYFENGCGILDFDPVILENKSIKEIIDAIYSESFDYDTICCLSDGYVEMGIHKDKIYHVIKNHSGFIVIMNEHDNPVFLSTENLLKDFKKA